VSGRSSFVLDAMAISFLSEPMAGLLSLIRVSPRESG
jgi:hypothetical protein